MYVLYVCVVCVCARGQEREFIMLLASSIRVSAPDRNMGKQLWDSLPHDEAGQSIDFKHRKWEFPITVKVRAVNCR